MSSELKQLLWLRRNSSLKFVRIMMITLITLVFVLINVYGQGDTSQNGDISTDNSQSAEITRIRYLNEILKLIDEEKFDEAQKKIRRGRLYYTNDSDLSKLEAHLNDEIKEAEKQTPLQLIKEEIPNLLLLGRINEANDKLAEARQNFPRDEFLKQSNYAITFMVWLRSLLMIVGLIILLSIISIGIIYIKSKFVAACIYIFAWYLTSIPIAVLLFLSVIPILMMGKESGDGRLPLQQGSLATLSCFAGALGGAVSASFALITMPAKIKSNLKFSVYFFKPINGFFIAFIMFVGVMSGQFAFSSAGGDLGPQARWSLCLLAILSGFFSDAAIEKLREIKQAIFGKEVTIIPSEDEVSVNSKIENPSVKSEKEGTQKQRQTKIIKVSPLNDV